MSGLDVRSFTVGPVGENAYIVRSDGEAARAVMIDPGEEPGRLLAAAEAMGVGIEAILITHCHFDHIGAVAPVAKATGAPVYCPEIEQALLADIMRWVPQGFGPFDSYDADHTVAGGEQLHVAGLQIDVIFTPGHSPGHVTYAIAGAPAHGRADDANDASAGEQPPGPPSPKALFSGDVLFGGSVGRTDLPGGDWATLERSIGTLLGGFPADTMVYPGHMGATTLARERDTNPFLVELRSRLQVAAVPRGAQAGS